MTTSDNDTQGKKLKLKRPGKLELSKTVEQGKVKQSFSHGRSKQVAVEVKRKRTYQRGDNDRMTEVREDEAPTAAPAAPQQPAPTQAPSARAPRAGTSSETASRSGETETQERGDLSTTHSDLTEQERQARLRAVEEARRQAEEEAKRQAEEDARREAEEAEARRQAEEEARRQAEEEARRKAEAEADAKAAAEPDVAPGTPEESAPEAPAAEQAAKEAPAAPQAETPAAQPATAPQQQPAKDGEAASETARKPKAPVGESEEASKARKAKAPAKKPATGKQRTGGDRRKGKLTITQALEDGEEGGRQRSMAAVRRQREREKQRQRGMEKPQKVLRDVVIPDAITVGELAQRMAERSADVVKALMKMGTMATANQTIDAETAELIVEEFGHTAKRVSESDVEEGLHTADDVDENKVPRPPVVTVMGHVDHGKTSLLDALRKTDVVAGEAGGITQHIGAYQVVTPSGSKISFIDTPGHAAFTEMRSRGADVTDIVILVVAADDGIKDQTVEAINHAKAAGVPMIVAINKCDKPAANPDRVRQELLNYEVVTEEMGGETLTVEVSAVSGMGITELDEAITLQAELLDLKANPDRPGEGRVIEAKLEKGRGPVATVLVQRGTLRRGDVFVAGAEWGRVRALVNDRGQQVKEAGPSVPVEVLGLQGTPKAGDEVVVVENDQRAREISEYRQEKQRQKDISAASRGSLEQMLSRIKEGQADELPIVVKADVQGSLEAIQGALDKLGNEEVRVRVLHTGVGGINESDVSLAGASDAAILAFNVRANGKAREVAKRDNVNIRYYSVIYNLVDDVKAALEGMLAPHAQENFIGYAEVRHVFSISKVGKVAGCRITEGVVKRGAGVRLLRDNVVVYEGELKTLKRFKDEVKEVKSGYECGIALENFNDLREGDLIECYEVQEVGRTL
jgi:translation initiation factor IF-2